MSYSTIIYTTKDHVASITLNRPEAGNRLNLELAQELAEVCRRINQDETVYVVILSGVGDKAFCEGGGVEEMGTVYSAANAVAAIEKPVIAAVNGDALGPGLELALSCDIRLASDRAKFGFPEVAKGFIPAGGGTQRLPRIVGRGKALEMILTAEAITAEEALEIGLVSKTVPSEGLMTEVEALAKDIAAKGPVALRFIKEAVNKGLDLTLEQGLRLEADLYFLLHTTADRTEGINAFLEKRKPKFKGQ
ncbi:MAG: enoyl-CoA hydratase/isomerase family protein [Deltaproteobacteria bacterium]|nr:enoyl-CoA hydratase/isomerase family protein [Deltaproteobacteria bacterium]